MVLNMSATLTIGIQILRRELATFRLHLSLPSSGRRRWAWRVHIAKTYYKGRRRGGVEGPYIYNIKNGIKGPYVLLCLKFAYSEERVRL